MPKFVIDLSEYRETQSARVPEGDYLVQVDYADMDKSKAGNDMIICGLRIAHGDQAGSLIVDRLTLSPKALFRVVGFMQALGIKTPRGPVQVDSEAWVGQYLAVTLRDGEPYNGAIKSEIAAYMRASTLSEGAAAAQASAFAAGGNAEAELIAAGSQTPAVQAPAEVASQQAQAVPADVPARLPASGVIDLATISL